MSSLTLVTTCSWCAKTISIQTAVELPANSVLQRIDCTDDKGTPVQVWGVESHGICKPCRDRIMAPVDLWPEVPTCIHGNRRGEWCTGCEAEV